MKGHYVSPIIIMDELQFGDFLMGTGEGTKPTNVGVDPKDEKDNAPGRKLYV